jgi:nicotinate-nucleotide pyrophosphorylase (carboxylating)
MSRTDIARSRETQAFIRRALREDIGPGDATSLALIPRAAVAEAVITAQGTGVLAGAAVAAAVFRAVDRKLRIRHLVRDGRRVRRGVRVLTLRGSARSILAAERTALNILQRLSGIASLTARFAAAVQPHRLAILDTRKTTPGMRALEKYAVRCGGGRNHRRGLYDRILIKDNHRCFWRRAGEARLDLAVQAARRRFPRLEVEVEVESAAEMESALAGWPEWILLDNMTPARLRQCVRRCAGRARLEASGGVRLENVKAIAATGVDAISIGSLTHSAPAADFSLEIVRGGSRRRVSAS